MAQVQRRTHKPLTAAEIGLKAGKQNWKEDGSLKLEYGISITDACIGWDETKSLLLDAAEAIRATR